MSMNVQAKVDWIGTPKPYIYKDEVTYDATSIDFSLTNDDNRYKLIVLSSEENTHYKIVPIWNQTRLTKTISYRHSIRTKHVTNYRANIT